MHSLWNSCGEGKSTSSRDSDVGVLAQLQRAPTILSMLSGQRHYWHSVTVLLKKWHGKVSFILKTYQTIMHMTMNMFAISKIVSILYLQLK